MNPQTFFDHFERLTDAPNTVARLRELILQLAVQGKLVEQNERDESASILLEKIKADKTRLIKEKKIGVDELLPTIEADDQPFGLPIGWQWVHLNQITNTIHYGYTASANHSLKDVRLLRITDIQNGKVDWDIVPGCEIDKDKIKGVELRDGDLLIARTGGTIGKSFLVENVSVRAVFASYLIRAVPNKFLFPKYLKLFLESELYWRQLYAKSMGTGQPNVNATSLKSLLVPLPPLEEQKRIVAKVDELMRLCDELERVQAERCEARQRLNRAALDRLLAACDAAEFQARWQTITDNFPTLTAAPDQIGKLRQTVLQLAVQGKLTRQDPRDEPAPALLQRIRAERERLVKEKKLKRADPLPPVNPDETPFALPSGWTWARISEICELGTGSTPLTSNPAYYEGGDVPWVTSAATSQVFIYDADTYITQAAVRDYRLRIYPPETLIVALYGQGKTRGQISQLKVAAAINQACAAISFTDTYKEMTGYVRLFFEKSYVELRSLAAGGAQPNLNLIKIKETLMPLPPLEEQKRIVAAVHRLMALCDELEAGLRRAEEDGERIRQAAVRSLLSPAPENSMRVPALA